MEPPVAVVGRFLILTLLMDIAYTDPYFVAIIHDDENRMLVFMLAVVA